MLEDLAALTGARVLGPATGTGIRGARLADFGRAERATATPERTTIEGGHGDERAIQARLSQIGGELAYLDSEYERDKRRYRRACLTGSVAKVRIGLDTVVEQEETRLRVIDGIRAGRAAMRSGTVPGGGSMLIRVASALSSAGGARGARGSRVLIRSLEAPVRQLAANAGLDPAVALRRVRAAPPGFGLDVRHDEIVDLRAAGVIDPVDVLCTALEAGVSIAVTALKAEAIIAQRPLPPTQRRPYGHHHGHDHGHFGGVAPGHEHAHADGNPSAHGHAEPHR
jgi:chaperonin GroEL